MELVRPMVEITTAKHLMNIRNGDVVINEEVTDADRLEYQKTMQDYRLRKLRQALT